MLKSKEKTLPKLPLLVPKSKEGCTYLPDTDTEDDEDKGDAVLATKEEVADDETVAKMPKGPIDPRVQQMIIAWTERSYKAYEAFVQRQQMQVDWGE